MEPREWAQFKAGFESKDAIERFTQSYLKESRRLVKALREALVRRDPQAVRIAAHTLRPTSAMLGAKPLAKLCSQLEDLGSRGELGVMAEDLVARVETMRRGVEDVLRSKA